jgi:hypothetical protein
MAAVLNDYKDGCNWTGYGNAATIGPFILLGGRYAVTVSSNGGTASVQLNVLSPDGSYISCGAAVTATGVFDCAPGTYELVTGAAASVCAGSMSKVPYSPVA